LQPDTQRLQQQQRCRCSFSAATPVQQHAACTCEVASAFSPRCSYRQWSGAAAAKMQPATSSTKPQRKHLCDGTSA
jgi:hypothetical protein